LVSILKVDGEEPSSGDFNTEEGVDRLPGLAEWLEERHQAENGLPDLCIIFLEADSTQQPIEPGVRAKKICGDTSL
jgi:hypothetical protein